MNAFPKKAADFDRKSAAFFFAQNMETKDPRQT
jgi:hypothetical protein